MFKEKSRDRRLTDSERETFLKSVMAEPNQAIRDYILISLFSGARRSNVLSMHWEDISFKDASWRIPDTKNGTPQTVPLSEIELLILRERQENTTSPWVFPGPGKTGHMVEPKAGWKRVLQRAGIEDLRIHDLRRSLASWMVDTGAPLSLIGNALNQKDIRTTQIYARVAKDPVAQAKKKAINAMLEGMEKVVKFN